MRVTVDRHAIDSSGKASPTRSQTINSLGTVSGARGRYDILLSTANGSDFDTDDMYLVRADSGKLLVVRGGESDYFERTFDQPLPGLPRTRGNADGGPQLSGATIHDLTVVSEAAGSTDTIEGRPTVRTRLVAQYVVTVKGESRGGRTIMELWTTPLAAQPVNPFERLPDGPLGPGLDSVFARLNGMRAQTGGAAVRVVTTTTVAAAGDTVLSRDNTPAGGFEITETTLVTLLRERQVDPADLEVPVGFLKIAPPP